MRGWFLSTLVGKMKRHVLIPQGPEFLGQLIQMTSHQVGSFRALRLNEHGNGRVARLQRHPHTSKFFGIQNNLGRTILHAVESSSHLVGHLAGLTLVCRVHRLGAARVLM